MEAVEELGFPFAHLCECSTLLRSVVRPMGVLVSVGAGAHAVKTPSVLQGQEVAEAPAQLRWFLTNTWPSPLSRCK